MHTHTAGGGNSYTLHVHKASNIKAYTSIPYTLHIHTVLLVVPRDTSFTFILLVVQRDTGTPCTSKLHASGAKIIILQVHTVVVQRDTSCTRSYCL
jgi:hypothetical protein